MKVYEGTIISCDNKNSVYEYLVEEDGIIKFLGDALPEKYKGADRFSLGEKALLPSFADTHLHFLGYVSPPDIEALISRYSAPIRPDHSRPRNMAARTAVNFTYRVA